MNSRLNLRYLVVGTGRSGTVFLAKLLTSAGIPCSHERIFSGGDIAQAREVMKRGGENSECSSYFGLESHSAPIAEASYMAVPFLTDASLRDCALIHVVRDPLKVIRSFLNNILFFREEQAQFLHPHEVFIRKHLPHLDLISDAASRASYYYLRWNQIIEESVGARRYIRYRIEDDPQNLRAFLEVGPEVPFYSEPANRFSQWPANMRAETELQSISDEEIMSSLFWKEVAALAANYGYSYSSKFLPDLNRVHPNARSHKASPNGPLSATTQRTVYRASPQMIEEGYYGFNLVDYRKSVYAVPQGLGNLDIERLGDKELQDLRGRQLLFVGNSMEEAKRWVNREADHPFLILKKWLWRIYR